MPRAATKNTTEQRDHEIIRVEANLEELPVFAAAKRARREEVVVWRREGRDPATRKPIEQTITLRPAMGVGLPAELERDLYYLVLTPWLEKNGFGTGGRIGPIRYQDACAMLGWKRSGRAYELIRTAVRTLASLRIEFVNAIMDGRTRRLLEHGGGLFSEYDMYAETPAAVPDRFTRGDFTLRAAPWFVENWRANYRKPIDLAVYRALRTPIAKALYPYLDKRAYRQGSIVAQVEEDVETLRNNIRLGVRRMDHLLEELRRAHADLLAAWPLLRDVRFEKIRPGRYNAVYVFSTQLELLTAPRPPKREQTKEREPADLELDLTARGVTAAVARRLVRDHDETLIRRQIDIHDQEMTAGQKIENPGGRLHRRIVDDWTPFDGYRTPDDRMRVENAKRAEAQKRRAEQEHEERERARWNALTPEQKADERVQRWVMVQTSFKKPPSEAQIAEQRSKYLDDYLAPQNADSGL